MVGEDRESPDSLDGVVGEHGESLVRQGASSLQLAKMR